jgi:hypothetical protein
MIALMMEAASTSETSVNFYQTTRHNNPEVNHLLTHRRDTTTYSLVFTNEMLFCTDVCQVEKQYYYFYFLHSVVVLLYVHEPRVRHNNIYVIGNVQLNSGQHVSVTQDHLQAL